MSEQVRIGIIGVGQIGNVHLENYSKIPEAKIVAVADLSPEKIEAAKARYGIEHGYSDFRELLKRDDIDAIDVAVHNNKHAPLTIAALKAGKHVYCEKPMAGSYRDAEEMITTAKKLNRRLAIQLSSLYSPENRAAKKLIDEGELGKVYYARSFGYRRRGRPFVDGYGTANFVDKSISAGGALFDMGVYHIAQVLHLLGNPAVKTVSGATHQELAMYDDRRQFSGYSVEEMGLGFVRLDGGISFDIEETWAVHHDGSEASKILGSKGGLKLNPLTYFHSVGDVAASATLDVKAADSRWHSCVKETEWFDSSQKHWVGVLLGKVEQIPTAEIALNTALISEGIYRSSKAGREVTAEEVRRESTSLAIDPYTPEKVWK
jgi:predicted dehydrogenase